jgi:hypothetical protein
MQKSYVDPPVRPLLPEQLPFLSILNFVLRHLPLMLVLGAILSTALVIRKAKQPTTYISTSLVSTGDEAPGSRIFAFLGAGAATPAAPGYIDLLSAPVFLQSLAQVPLKFPTGMQPAAQFYGAGLPPERAAEAGAAALSGRIDAAVLDPSGWLELKTEGDTPEQARELNFAVLAQLDTFNARKRRKLSIENQQFAAERLAELGADVKEAEDRMIAFERRNRDLSSPELRLQSQHLADTLSRRKGLYSAILASYDRERLEAERLYRPMTLMGSPTLPQAPDPRNFTRAVILGLFGGGFLGAIVGGILDYFRSIERQGSPQYREFVELRSRLFGWLRLPRRKAAA